MSRTIIKLDKRLDLLASAPLAAGILEHSGQDLELDASDVEHIGALAVQVMRAAAKSWAASGHDLALADPTEDCAQQLAILGYAPETVTLWEGGE